MMPGTVDQNVQFSPFVDDFLDDLRRAVAIANIVAENEHFATGIANALGDYFRLLRFEIDQSHLGTFSGETLGNGSADPLAGSRNQGGFFQTNALDLPLHPRLWARSANGPDTLSAETSHLAVSRNRRFNQRFIANASTVGKSGLAAREPAGASMAVRRDAWPVVRSERRYLQSLAVLQIADRVFRPSVTNGNWFRDLVAEHFDFVLGHDPGLGPDEFLVGTGDCESQRLTNIRSVETSADMIEGDHDAVAFLSIDL